LRIGLDSIYIARVNAVEWPSHEEDGSMLPIFTYPGVYVEELPSAVHRIPGVSTSIAAFVGWAPPGPVNQATLVQSWQDFHTQFGGWNPHSYLGSAVKQFFANGGQQAYIVRDGTAPLQGKADLAALLKTVIENLPVRRRRRW
jgi:hypothetical protein